MIRFFLSDLLTSSSNSFATLNTSAFRKVINSSYVGVSTNFFASKLIMNTLIGFTYDNNKKTDLVIYKRKF